MAVAYLLRAMRYYFNSPYGAMKFVKPLPVIYTVVSVLKIGLILIFIKQYELYAIIGATFATNIMEIFLLRWAIRERFTFQYNPFKLVIAPILLGVVILAGELLMTDAMLLRHVGYLIVCILILWWFYRNELKLVRPFGLFK